MAPKTSVELPSMDAPLVLAEVAATEVLGGEGREASRELNFYSVAGPIGGEAGACREGCLEEIGGESGARGRCWDPRSENYCGTLALHTAKDDLRRCHTGSLIQLELRNQARLNFGSAGINSLALTFTKLVRHVGRQVTECRQNNRKIRLD